MKRFAAWLDTWPTLGRLLSFISTKLAHYRGVPILAGVILTVISLFIHLIAAATGSPVWQALAFIALHLAILVGLVGVMMAEPLGRG